MREWWKFLSDRSMQVMSESILHLKSMSQLNLNLSNCSGEFITIEGVVSLGRMLSGLSAITNLTLNMSGWEGLSERSI